MKQDGQGEWIPVDAVKMTESFWNNWYVYTVKDPSNPRSVKLVGYDWTNGGSNPWNYSDYKPKFYNECYMRFCAKRYAILRYSPM